MDINELLKGKDCECGRRHDCPIDLVCIESGAEERLKDVFPDDKNILIVADENTFAADGEAVIRALAGRNAKRIIFPGSEILVPDEKAIAAVEDALGDTTAIVGIGSGVIQDLCKYVSHDRRIPYAIVATATSMDGYASDGAAMILGGMKVTVSTHAPVKYAGPLEYGHGGPHPAPAHPYLRPAFDEKKDEAYAAIVDAVIELMNDLGI